MAGCALIDFVIMRMAYLLVSSNQGRLVGDFLMQRDSSSQRTLLPFLDAARGLPFLDAVEGRVVEGTAPFLWA